MTCTTLKSTLSLTTVFLLPVMRFAKLNKPPPPTLKSAWKKISPLVGLIEDLRYLWERFCYIKVAWWSFSKSTRQYTQTQSIRTNFMLEILCLQVRAPHNSGVLSPSLIFTWTAGTINAFEICGDVSYWFPWKNETWTQNTWIMRGVMSLRRQLTVVFVTLIITNFHLHLIQLW